VTTQAGHRSHAPAEATDGRLRRQLEAWSRGVGPELAFWDLWLRTRGHRWPGDWRRRMDPAAPLDASLARQARALGDVPGGTLRLLDVGAGPVSMAGQRLDAAPVALTAVDPLAPLYAVLLEKHGQRPPVPTRFAVAEDLRLFLPEQGFDLVHCRNALDQSFDPLRGLEEMLAALRPGGRLLLRHIRNEAENEGYGGFHQWNFDLDEAGGRFLIWNRGTPAIDVGAALATPCRVEARQADMLEVVIEKTGDSPPAAPGAAAARMACYLEAFVGVLGAPALQRLPDASPPVPEDAGPPQASAVATTPVA
jgi:SAM-dependent methyltransferase